jgi:hypothetical protein
MMMGFGTASRTKKRREVGNLRSSGNTSPANGPIF